MFCSNYGSASQCFWEFDVNEYNDLEIRVMGHSKLSKVTPLNSLPMVTYYRPLVTLSLKCTIFTAQCTLVQMRGLGITCRLSVRLSICNVGDLWSHRLEILETNCMAN